MINLPEGFGGNILCIKGLGDLGHQLGHSPFQPVHQTQGIKFRLHIFAVHRGNIRRNVALIINIFGGFTGLGIQNNRFEMVHVLINLADQCFLIVTFQNVFQFAQIPGQVGAVTSEHRQDIIKFKGILFQ